MSKYGIPYQGSKSTIADWIIEQLPSAENFVDLFAGGCAVTHAAMQSGKWSHFIINDINPMPTKLFMDAVAGRIPKEKLYAWISREDFFELRDIDPFVRYVWSFGNNGTDYMYSKEIEAYKQALHNLFTADDIQERIRHFKKVLELLPMTQIDDGSKARAVDIERAARIENLGRAARIENLGRIERYSEDYTDIKIPDNSVVYCDIPYKGTKAYGKQQFDYERFYDWITNLAKDSSYIYIYIGV